MSPRKRVRPARVSIYLTPAEADAIDARRGEVSRSDYFRTAAGLEPAPLGRPYPKKPEPLEPWEHTPDGRRCRSCGALWYVGWTTCPMCPMCPRQT